MAADEALLEAAVAGQASLRFYGWDPPTVSVGYFQSSSVRRADPLLVELPFVRRPSGGGTLVHDHEVTYCLALPPAPPWQTGESWLCRMHHIIAAALGEFGVTARPQPTGSDQRLGPVLCFQHFTPGDLVVAAAKVVGSAQRKQRGALMQHGGILLARSAHAPALAGIQELSGQTLDAVQVREAVSRQFMLHTGWQLVPAGWTENEATRKNNLARAKYSSEAWSHKR
jgi:lipoate-protein ligase A